MRTVFVSDPDATDPEDMILLVVNSFPMDADINVSVQSPDYPITLRLDIAESIADQTITALWQDDYIVSEV